MTKINFNINFQEDQELEEELVVVNSLYSLPIRTYRNGYRFIIPKAIVRALGLYRTAPVYFSRYGELIFIDFNPRKAPEEHFAVRKIQAGGMYNTLYVQIPKQIINYNTDTIQLYQADAEEVHSLWQLQILSYV